MKYILSTILPLLLSQILWSQCTPIDCSASLPVYGGICDTVLIAGIANTAYADSESFVVTDACFDSGILDPTQPGFNVQVTTIDNFTFSGLPTGLTAVTNAAVYVPVVNSYTLGCMAVSGVPTEAGIFSIDANFLIDVDVYLFGACTGTPATVFLDQPFVYNLSMDIKPDATFAGLNSSYCQADPTTVLVPATPGGTFSGPGILGNTFDPATAGIGTHTITYTVSAQQGVAVAPSTNTSTMMVTIATQVTYYADADGDGYGDDNTSVQGCSAPSGYITLPGDCDDTDNTVNPSATEICDNKDNNCSGLVDDGLPVYQYFRDADNDNFGDPNTNVSTCAVNSPAGFVPNDQDCDDTNPGINPAAIDIPNNGIDEDCDGSDATTTNNEDLEKMELTIVPNPSSGWITIQTDQSRLKTLQIIDISGKILQEITDFNTSDLLDLSELSTGIYLLKATDLKRATTVKSISVIR